MKDHWTHYDSATELELRDQSRIEIEYFTLPTPKANAAIKNGLLIFYKLDDSYFSTNKPATASHDYYPSIGLVTNQETLPKVCKASSDTLRIQSNRAPNTGHQMLDLTRARNTIQILATKKQRLGHFMNLYIDCTETHRSKFNTGIQRVVRKIVEHSNGTPVIYDGIGFRKISKQELLPSKSNTKGALRDFIAKFPFVLNMAKATFNVLTCAKNLIFYPKNRKNYIEFTSEDTLLAADIINDIRLANRLLGLNIPVYQIVYDLLPITHPELFPTGTSDRFLRTAQSWAKYSNKIFAISRKVAEDIQTTLGVDADYFYLGSDFINIKTNKEPSVRNYALMVGTIEPRKNHLHVLKAFQQLWEMGEPINLVIIGKKGWNFNPIVQAIVSLSSLFPGRLTWISDCDDETLESFYREAEVVICASIDEGFGLPLVEALSRGKNVLAHDISVFREIGQDFCAYFTTDHGDTQPLINTMRAGRYKKDISSFKWPNWEESVVSLVKKIQSDYESRIRSN